MLEMKEDCQTCGADLSHEADALICTFECTFCPNCAKATDHICPNCNGALVPRPKRRA